MGLGFLDDLFHSLLTLHLGSWETVVSPFDPWCAGLPDVQLGQNMNYKCYICQRYLKVFLGCDGVVFLRCFAVRSRVYWKGLVEFPQRADFH